MERPKLIGLVKLDFPRVLRRKEPKEYASSIAFDTEGRAWYPVHQLQPIPEEPAGPERPIDDDHERPGRYEGPRRRLMPPKRIVFVRWQRAQDMLFDWEPWRDP